MKKIFYGIVAATAILLSACGQKKTTEKVKPAKPAETVQSLYKKSEKASALVKNSTVDMNFSIKLDDQEVNIGFVGRQSFKPSIELLGTYSMASGGQTQKLDLYASDSTVLVKAKGMWLDASKELKQNGSLSTMGSKADLSSVPSSLLKKAKLTKKKGKYTVDLNLDGKDAKELSKKLIANTSVANQAEALDQLDTTRVHFILVYDAKTYLLAESHANVELGSNGKSISEKIDSKYGAYNQAAVLKPTEATFPK